MAYLSGVLAGVRHDMIIKYNRNDKENELFYTSFSFGKYMI